jgi:glycosyltransferase involved in cell wall biosynthesis
VRQQLSDTGEASYDRGVKVLLVHNHYQEYGGESSVYSLERRALQDAGVEVVEYVRHNDELRDYAARDRLTLPLRTLWAWDAQRALRSLIERERPELAHFTNTLPLISPAAYWTCQRAGVAVVQTLHNYRLACPAATFFRDGGVCEECPEHGLQRAVVHACYRGSRPASAAVAGMLAAHRRIGSYQRQVDTYIALTQFARAKLIETAGLPPERVVVKANFLECDPGPGDGQGERALFVGRWADYKGILTLLDAVADGTCGFGLDVVGSGPLEAVVRERAAAQRGGGAAAGGSMRLLGPRPPSEAIALIKRAALLVLPSLWYEGLPMVIVEAFACGVPVLASRLGSLSELVREGETGLLFTPGDPRDLRAKLDWAFANRTAMQRMGRAARVEFEARFSYRAGQAALLQVHRATLERRRGRQG